CIRTTLLTHSTALEARTTRCNPTLTRQYDDSQPAPRPRTTNDGSNDATTPADDDASATAAGDTGRQRHNATNAARRCGQGSAKVNSSCRRSRKVKVRRSNNIRRTLAQRGPGNCSAAACTSHSAHDRSLSEPSARHTSNAATARRQADSCRCAW